MKKVRLAEEYKGEKMPADLNSLKERLKSLGYLH
jgi:hypothetical protein